MTTATRIAALALVIFHELLLIVGMLTMNVAAAEPDEHMEPMTLGDLQTLQERLAEL